jgi:hypothetical protein
LSISKVWAIVLDSFDPFLRRQIPREEIAQALHVHDDLRECIVDEYLILYLLREKQIVFLSIKRHRQLSFDLKRFWQET